MWRHYAVVSNHRFRHLLPEATDAVPVEESLYRDEDEVARKRLRDEYSVEGVAVRAGQSSGARGVFHGDWQFLEALACDAGGDVVRKFAGVREFPEPMFGRDLPR